MVQTYREQRCHIISRRLIPNQVHLEMWRDTFIYHTDLGGNMAFRGQCLNYNLLLLKIVNQEYILVYSLIRNKSFLNVIGSNSCKQVFNSWYDYKKYKCPLMHKTVPHNEKWSLHNAKNIPADTHWFKLCSY